MEGEERERAPATGQQKLPAVRFVDGSEFGLPAGWMVEQRPRSSAKYLGKVDQFFYEPQTERQFRSLKSAKRHIQELGQNKQTLDTSQFHANSSKSTETQKKKKKSKGMDLEKPPDSVTWALSDAENDKWNAYIGENLVPYEVKEDWTQSFASLNQGNK